MTANDETTLYLGSYIDSSLEVGTYSTTLNFVAVTNYVPTPEITTTDLGYIPVRGGHSVTLEGTELSEATSVTIGGASCKIEDATNTSLTSQYDADTYELKINGKT